MILNCLVLDKNVPQACSNKLTLGAIKLNSTATEANKRFSGGNEVDQLKMNLDTK